MYLILIAGRLKEGWRRFLIIVEFYASIKKENSQHHKQNKIQRISEQIENSEQPSLSGSRTGGRWSRGSRTSDGSRSNRRCSGRSNRRSSSSETLSWRTSHGRRSNRWIGGRSNHRSNSKTLW